MADLTPELREAAGGKAAALARLWQAGYPVPDAFVVLPAEFAGDDLRPEVAAALPAHLGRLRAGAGDVSFAVRSSAVDEDGSEASFAGAFDTVLDACTDADVLDAIHAVRRSRHNVRADVYARGATTAPAAAEDHEMAVIVQRLIRPDVAGVLFTADPVTGDLMCMPGNLVHGLGETLVSGQASGERFEFDRLSGRYRGPQELRRFARRLWRLGVRLDAQLGGSQDIEWAVSGGRVWILQARPVASMREFNVATGEVNSSLLGDFIWTNGNAAEIQPEVMTLLTWSITRLWGEGYSRWWSRYPAAGCIGGRSYFNITVQVAPFARLPGGLKGAMRYVGDWWGRIPPHVTVPLAPFSWRQIAFTVAPALYAGFVGFRKYRPRIPGFVEETPEWCRAMRRRIAALDEAEPLAALWEGELKAYFCFGTAMASAANLSGRMALEKQLSKLVGEEDGNALLSNLGGAGRLASVEPVVALAAVAHGDLTAETYLERYGHRGPYEFELSHPQPADDPDWLDRQLADFRANPVDVEALLARQRGAFDAAWERLVARHPRKAKSIRRKLDDIGRLAAQREAARSEVTRVIGVIRAWAVRSGEVLGVGDDVFHITVDEIVAALRGDGRALRFVERRRQTYERYRALPPYPPVISGRFDPFAWAANPARRSDLYDAHAPAAPPASGDIVGFPGAFGVVEGVVRRLDRFEDGHLLQPGEVLVTTTTNVGWTPLFPRAAAIVTDVGAPLSHAAIVARELGIPAVVGCNDAMMRLKTGDRVRVDGGHGRVEVVSPMGHEQRSAEG